MKTGCLFSACQTTVCRCWLCRSGVGIGKSFGGIAQRELEELVEGVCRVETPTSHPSDII